LTCKPYSKCHFNQCPYVFWGRLGAMQPQGFLTRNDLIAMQS
jgi:hypothetical protein